MILLQDSAGYFYTSSIQIMLQRYLLVMQSEIGFCKPLKNSQRLSVSPIMSTVKIKLHL